MLQQHWRILEFQLTSHRTAGHHLDVQSKQGPRVGELLSSPDASRCLPLDRLFGDPWQETSWSPYPVRPANWSASRVRPTCLWAAWLWQSLGYSRSHRSGGRSAVCGLPLTTFLPTWDYLPKNRPNFCFFRGGSHQSFPNMPHSTQQWHCAHENWTLSPPGDPRSACHVLKKNTMNWMNYFGATTIPQMYPRMSPSTPNIS